MNQTVTFTAPEMRKSLIKLMISGNPVLIPWYNDKSGRLVEERSGRGKVSGPLHDFPLRQGESVTVFRRKGVRLRWRWDK